MLKKYIFPQLSSVLCVLFLGAIGAKAASVDTRSDSFTVSHYAISLDFSNLSSKSLSGQCTLKGASRIDKLDRLSLELYKLNVDSVWENGKKTGFQYNDSLLTPHFASLYNTGDSFTITVFYHGHPVSTSWGGFTFDGNNQYAYNLGIGLYTNPPNLGRAWFPCVDNFIDKATFGFFMKTAKGSKAFCNGLLMDSAVNFDNTITWHWEMHQPITPYLAAVAIGPYKTIYGNFTGKAGKTPIMIGVTPNDTAKALVTFQHLNLVLAEYEGYYGPYPFDRVGFVGVNFNGGAMEHASNITLPNTTIEGGLTDEYLWAHELSHQWFGDLVTCKTASDMWLNEGWACFNESMFQEKLYGTKTYHTYALGIHYQALRYGTPEEGGYVPLSPAAANHTYGTTTYDKGACVARTMRSYLGDSLFFKGLQTYMHDFSFQSANSTDFQSSLSKSTGVDMTGFFNDWVFGGGWPHFEIDKRDSDATGYNLTITRHNQTSSGSYIGTPLEITWYDANWKQNIIPFKTNTNIWNVVHIPSQAIFAGLDMDGKITDATTKQYKVFKTATSFSFAESLININVDAIKDSALVFVTQHWIGAERTANTPKNIRLSSDRYWTVDGIFPNGFHATATVIYDGRSPSTPTSGGYLDNNFLKGHIEDSMVLMYKPVYGGDWIMLKENTDYTKTQGSSNTDEFGNMRILNLKKGQYCFGLFDKNAGIPEPVNIQDHEMMIYPNPMANALHIKFGEPVNVKSLQVFDSGGKQVRQINSPYPAAEDILLSDLNLENGSYILCVTTPDGLTTKKFIVER